MPSLHKPKVLDASALLTYFEDQPGAQKVTETLKRAAEEDQRLLMSVINWGEVLYVMERRHGKDKRDAAERLMDQMGLEIIDTDKELTRQAAHLKAENKLPYGDSFTAALAFIQKAELVTADRDFKSVEDKVSILWV